MRKLSLRYGLVVFVFLIVVATLVLTRSASAQATHNCRAYDLSVATLFERFQEAPVARGVSANGTLMVIFLNPASGTWTVLMVQADEIRTSCIAADGTAWENLPYEEPALKPQLQSL